MVNKDRAAPVKHPFGKAIGDIMFGRYPEQIKGEPRPAFLVRRKPFMEARQRMMHNLYLGDSAGAMRIARKVGITGEFIALAMLLHPNILEGIDLSEFQPQEE